MGPTSNVAGFPTLEKEKQSLVQMKTSMGKIVVGIRDNDNGTFNSGWVVIDSGVEIEPFDNHSHYHTHNLPELWRLSLMQSKVIRHTSTFTTKSFMLRTTKKNGFTRLDLRNVNHSASAEDVLKQVGFFEGGGGHITSMVSSSWPPAKESFGLKHQRPLLLVSKISS